MMVVHGKAEAKTTEKKIPSRFAPENHGKTETPNRCGYGTSV